jgi:acetyl-CoA carboxylase carboxyltransferase component
MACLSDFVVQVKGSSMAVSGPRVLELAISEKISEEELGGWRVHAETTGMTDMVADDEEHCFQIIRKYLDYMPSNNRELPPVRPVPEGSGGNMDTILDFVPEQRNRGYDMYNVIRTMVDGGEVFPLKDLFGRMLITCLARMGGHTVGFVANQPFFMGGAMDADGIDKFISFMVLCDSFNIPLIFLHDIPGFFVGRDAEQKRVAGKIINHMVALAQVTVPKISIIIRKTYGMAFFNMCGTGCGADFLVAWPSADISFMDPEVGVNVVFGAQFRGRENADEERQKFLEKWGYECSPFPAAGLHHLDDVIDPPETRDYIIRCLEIARGTLNGGIGEHRLANWPTKF